MAKEKIDLQRTFLDRAIGLFSPAAELRRVQSRLAVGALERSFEGASRGRRTQNWRASNASVNEIIKGGLPVLRARARDLARNQPYAKKARDSIVGNMIGDGIIPQTRSDKAEVVKTLENLWISWGDETACDADGRYDFYGLQALAVRTIVDSGSVLVRRRWRRKSDGLALPFQLQMLEPDYLDRTKDGATASGGRIIGGVEFDLLGRRVAYHLYNYHPGDSTVIGTPLASSRIVADDVQHIFWSDRIGQVDGIPWGSPCIIRLRDLDEFEDAQLIKQKISACFVGVVHDVEAPDTPTEAQAEALSRFEPGMFEQLPPGKNITFGTPPPADNGPYQAQVLRGIAAGYGTTYEAMTGDYSQVNFSSGRMGNLEFQRNVRQWQNHMMIPQLCKPVWRWFMEAAIFMGHATEFVPATWTPPRREMIDPEKETNAAIMAIRGGLKSKREVIQELGRDPAAVYGEQEADNKVADEKGFVFDSDPRKVARSGTTQAVLPAPAPES